MPGHGIARNPGLQHCERKDYRHLKMLRRPNPFRNDLGNIQFQRNVEEPGRHQQQRENKSRINPGEARLPEFLSELQSPRIGIDHDESGEDEEEMNSHVSDVSDDLKPFGAKKNAHRLSMEYGHPNSSQKTD